MAKPPFFRLCRYRIVAMREFAKLETMVQFHLPASTPFYFKTMLILGKHCPDEKGLCFTLQSVFGVNATTACKICAMVGVHRNVPLRELLKTRRVDKLNRLCRDYISASAERHAKQNIKHYLNIKHYKGVRHMFALPARGQRTRTNASTSRRLAVIKHLDPKKRAQKKGGHSTKSRRGK